MRDVDEMSPKNRLERQGDLPLSVGREVDEEAQRLLDQILEEDEASMQITAPYRPEKVSTNKVQGAQLNRLDERSVDYAIKDLSDDVEDLNLVVNSPGGAVGSANKIARALDNNFESIEVYVPHFAKSGGTLISLTGDQIVMGELSDLGPLDPQTPNGEGETYSTTDLMDAYDKSLDRWQNTSPSEASAPEQSLIQNMDLLKYEEAKKLTDTMVHYAENILSQKEGVSDREAARTAQSLVGSYPIHGYTLTRDEAAEALPEGMVVSESDRPEEMDAMRKWMDQYAFDNSSSHAVVYHEK